MFDLSVFLVMLWLCPALFFIAVSANCNDTKQEETFGLIAISWFAAPLGIPLFICAVIISSPKLIYNYITRRKKVK